jgi:hypothetical protein
MGQFDPASCSIVALLRPYTIGLIGFQAILLFHKTGKCKLVYNVAYLSRLDRAVRPNGKSGRVSGNSMDHLQVTI